MTEKEITQSETKTKREKQIARNLAELERLREKGEISKEDFPPSFIRDINDDKETELGRPITRRDLMFVLNPLDKKERAIVLSTEVVKDDETGEIVIDEDTGKPMLWWAEIGIGFITVKRVGREEPDDLFADDFGEGGKLIIFPGDLAFNENTS